MGLKTGGPVSVHTSHCPHVKSHLTLWKRVGSCGRWWWMTMHQHMRERNSETYKSVLPLITDCDCWGMWGDLLQNWYKDGVGKRPQMLEMTPQIKGERWERERMREWDTNKLGFHLDPVHALPSLHCSSPSQLWNRYMLHSERCWRLSREEEKIGTALIILA